MTSPDEQDSLPSAFSHPPFSEYHASMEVSCPTCRVRVVWDQSPYRPFCSERCKLVDLGKWLNEEYRIPGADDESEAAPSGHGPSRDD